MTALLFCLVAGSGPAVMVAYLVVGYRRHPMPPVPSAVWEVKR